MEPPSPSASFYDMSDDEEGGYNTIAHANRERGVKLLYSKSKVYVHPTPSARDNISGFIALVQQKSAPFASDERPGSSNSSKQNDASRYLLAWVPESSLNSDDLNTYVKVDMKDNESPPKQTYLVPPLPVSSSYDDTNVGPYAFSLPLSNIYSVLVRPPSIGWWFGSIVVNTKSGSSLPALFFHDSECESTILQKKKRARESFDPFGDGNDLFWGGDEVVRWLKRYVTVERSTAEPSVYLINPSEEDLLGFGQGRKSFEGSRPEDKPPQKKQPSGPGMDPLTKALKETRWKLLENFAKITTFTRKTAQDIVNNNNVPPQVRRILQNPDVQTMQDEFDSARLYLARWAMGIAEQSERERRQRIFTAKDVLATEDTDVGEFEILDGMEGMSMNESKRRPVKMNEWKGFFDSKGRLHVTEDEPKERIFHGGLDMEDGVRKEAWPFLLGLYGWNSTTEERRAQMNSLRDQYIRLKGQWWERMIEGQATEEQEEWWREQKNRIGKSDPLRRLAVTHAITDLATRHVEKDVHRTDRHIPLFAGEDIPHPDPSSPFYNEHTPGTNVHMEQMKDMLLTYLEYDTPPAEGKPSSSYNSNPQNLGYVQGMSDLLSPLYAVFQDDALAFWCFVHFMKRMSRNFVRSQKGMRTQLQTLDQLVQLLDPKLYLHLQKLDSTNFFFFFRMLLVWYKREFEWSDVLRLWESLWTDYYSSQFHLFIAVAILEKHRDVIMEHLRGFDEVLKYVNELSNTIDLQSTLIRAEGLFQKFEKIVQAIDKKNNFPPAPRTDLRQRQGKGKEVADRPDNDSGPSQAQSSSNDAAASGHKRTESETDRERIISPELRLLLSRKMVTLDEGDDAAGHTRASGLRD